jgi:excisionase family DNA binding protein
MSSPPPAPEPANAIIERQLLTADEVAVMLRVPKSLVYALARRGELPAIHIGERYVRFRAEAIEEWTVGREAWPQEQGSSAARGRIARTVGSSPTGHRGASETSLRRRANAPEPGIRRVVPDAS